MRFWDSSAVVPLLVEEPASRPCREFLRQDRAVAVWALTRTEIVSALRRKERARELDRSGLGVALDRLSLMEAAWTEVDALRPVRERAERLLAVHALRAADAIQLAAALILCKEHPRKWGFVSCDDRLLAAAGLEGFDALEPRFG